MFLLRLMPPSLYAFYVSATLDSRAPAVAGSWGLGPLVTCALPCSSTLSLCLLPADLWRPGMDPDCLFPGTLTPGPGLGDVRVRVLLCGHHFPDGLVHNWYSWR